MTTVWHIYFYFAPSRSYVWILADNVCCPEYFPCVCMHFLQQGLIECGEYCQYFSTTLLSHKGGSLAYPTSLTMCIDMHTVGSEYRMDGWTDLKELFGIL